MLKTILHKLKEILATGFYTGYLPKGQGTFGTLIGVGIFMLLSRYTAVHYLLLAVLLILAVYVSDYAEKVIFKTKDAPHIVVDEIIGFLIAMVSFEFDGSIDAWRFMIIGFIAFRIFDIWKPYPIRQSQKLEGGLGIVIDDVLAGIYTNLILQFLRYNGSLLF